MSNPLSVRRVKIQTIDENGQPEGPPTYGILAADNYVSRYDDGYASLEGLNLAIAEAPSILWAVDHDDGFAGADHTKIGRANFYGKDWTK